MRKLLLALAVLVPTALVLTFLLAPRLLVWPLARLSPQVTFFISTDRPAVALTMDDGPHPETTPRVLEVLARHGVKTTFFLIGRQAKKHPDLLARMHAAGHELASHGYRDRVSAVLGRAELEGALARTRSVLAPYAEPRWLRPGGGWFAGAVIAAAESQGLRVVLGDVYPMDYNLPFPRFHAWYVGRNARPGSIILLHDRPDPGPGPAATLARILPGLTQRLRVTTLSELAALE